MHGYYAQKTIGLKQLENSQPRLSSALYAKLNIRNITQEYTIVRRLYLNVSFWLLVVLRLLVCWAIFPLTSQVGTPQGRKL